MLDGGKEQWRRLVEKLGAAAGQVASASHSLGDSFRPANSCGPRERGNWRERDRRERRTADYRLVIVSHRAEDSSEGAIGIHRLEGRVNNQLAMAQSAMFPVNIFA